MAELFLDGVEESWCVGQGDFYEGRWWRSGKGQYDCFGDLLCLELLARVGVVNVVSTQLILRTSMRPWLNSGAVCKKGSTVAESMRCFFKGCFLIGLELDEDFAPALLHDFKHQIFVGVKRIATNGRPFQSRLSCTLQTQKRPHSPARPLTLIG